MAEPVSGDFLRLLDDIANAMMDGKSMGEADYGIAGAMIKVLVDDAKERRAADLTADVRDLLLIVRACVDRHPCVADAYWRAPALAVLDRLLAHGGGK